MQCLQIGDWGGGLERRERPRPTVDDGQVLVEVGATGVGLTVGNVINGDLGADQDQLPRIPGHEFVGTVVETGPGVTHLQKGDFVGAYFYLSCDRCDACRRGRESLCANLEGYVSVDIDGGFAEYATLPARNALQLPPELDPVEATAIPDAIATPYHVMNQRADTDVGDSVMVLGAGGGVGIHLVQVAQLFGGDVTAVDRVPEKLDRCRELGAERVIDTDVTPFEEALEADGVTYDAIVDFTGSTELLETASDHLAPRGRIVNLTTFPGRTMDVSPRHQVFDEAAVVGSRYCSKYELRRAARLVADDDVEPVVTEVGSMEAVPELLDRIRAGDVVGRAAMRP